MRIAKSFIVLVEVESCASTDVLVIAFLASVHGRLRISSGSMVNVGWSSSALDLQGAHFPGLPI